MITIFIGEQRNGRIKLTTDRDCLAPDIIRFTERVFVDLDHMKASASSLEDRGFHVCVDTAEYFYETAQ